MKRLRLSTVAAGLLAGLLLGILAQPVLVRAAKLSDRSIAIDDPKPGAVTTHTFRFDIETAGSLGSIVLEYCHNDPLFENPCLPPAGLDVSTGALVAQSGQTGFTIHASSTANKLILTRTAAPAAPGSVQYAFTGITNPSSNNTTNYVRLSTHASTDGSGARIDEGGVAFRILSGISTDAYVPPYLLFCVGITVELDCAAATGNYLDLGELSTGLPKAGTSQYSGATNDESGYAVSIFASTLTSGNQIIPALPVPVVSQPGTSQFGINVRANTDPPVGQDPVGSGSAIAAVDYGTPDLFVYRSGDTLSSAVLPSEYNRFTVSYIVNIAADQAPGIYSSTFTYIATATF